jgi:hypothetical protein
MMSTSFLILDLQENGTKFAYLGKRTIVRSESTTNFVTIGTVVASEVNKTT